MSRAQTAILKRRRGSFDRSYACPNLANAPAKSPLLMSICAEAKSVVAAPVSDSESDARGCATGAGAACAKADAGDARAAQSKGKRADRFISGATGAG